MFLDCRLVDKTWAFHVALQTGTQKEVHPPYSPDLAPAGARSGEYSGLMFPWLKSIMKGARFADVAAIQERVATVLRSIPKQSSADSFQKLYERCQQCVVKDGSYFEGHYLSQLFPG
jgi:hypothetical protein